MSKKCNIGAGSGKNQTMSCDWEGCKGNPHSSKINYPNNGILHRATYTGSWDKNNTALFGIKKRITGEIQITRPRQRKGKIANNHYKVTTDSNFPVQYHHVIPITALKSGLPALKNNLILLGWDINNGTLNGITLPYNFEDMKRYDLQTHRGGHAKYNKDVKKSLKGLEGECKLYCKDGNQNQLLTEISEIVDVYRDLIVNWMSILHSRSLLLRHVV